MQFNVQRKQFVKALSFCQSIVEKKTAIPVLSHVLIKARDGKLTIVGTDLDIIISEELSADIQVEGALCVPSLLTYDIVKRLDGYDSLAFSYENAQLFLRCGRSEFRLPTLHIEQFPDISQLPLTSVFTIDPGQFKKLIDDTRLCMSDEDAQPTLNALYVHSGPDQILCVAATDLHRLALSQIQLDTELTLPSGLVIGRKAITEIRKLIDDKVQTMTLGASAARIQCDVMLEDLQIMFTSRLVDGVYPEYQKILEKKSAMTIQFNRIGLLAALERISVILDQKLKAVTFEFEQNLVTITAVNLDNGSGKEEIEIQFAHDPFKIQFNVFYLLDIAKQINTDQIVFSLDTPQDAVHIQPVGSIFPHYVVMPLVS